MQRSLGGSELFAQRLLVDQGSLIVGQRVECGAGCLDLILIVNGYLLGQRVDLVGCVLGSSQIVNRLFSSVELVESLLGNERLNSVGRIVIENNQVIY